MSIKKITLTSLFATAIACTAPVQAQESHVERVLSTMVNQAMETVTLEINEEVQKSILTTAYNLSFTSPADPTAPATTVTITDIASVKNAESDKTSDETED